LKKDEEAGERVDWVPSHKTRDKGNLGSGSSLKVPRGERGGESERIKKMT